MTIAKQEFLARLDILAACLDEASTNDGAPAEHQKNLIAAMIRQGLAVLSFAAFETFVRHRTSECLKSLDSTKLAFSDLSEAIQEAATIGATRGMLFRIKFEDPATRHAWARNQLESIAASYSLLEKISPLSFGSDKANLDDEDIPQILRSFGIDKPWISITSIAKRAGLGGLLDAKSQFTQVKKTRHSSAHEVSSNVPHGELSNSIRILKGLAIGFDILLSHSTSIHNLGRIPGRPPETKIETSQIKLLFIAPKAGIEDAFELYRVVAGTETTPETKAIVRTFDSKLDVIDFAVSESSISQEHIVDLNEHGEINEWHTWEVK